jgi:hypothetical protein
MLWSKKPFLKGKDLLWNPDFKKMKEEVQFSEEPFREDDETRIVLTAPARQGKEWFKHLASSKICWLVESYPLGNLMYSKPDEKEWADPKK